MGLNKTKADFINIKKANKITKFSVKIITKKYNFCFVLGHRIPQDYQ